MSAAAAELDDASDKPAERTDGRPGAGPAIEVLTRRLREALDYGRLSDPGPDEPELPADFSAALEEIVAIREFVRQISQGNLAAELKVRGQLAGSLKSLQANLRHLTWQVQQVAAGDHTQAVDFMGEFSSAFNSMIDGLERARRAEQEKIELAEAQREAAAALNRVYSIDDVLDNLAAHLGAIVPCDALDILMVEDGQAQVVRSTGRERQTPEALAALRKMHLPVEASAPLHAAALMRQYYLAGRPTGGPGWSGLPAADWAGSLLVAPVLIEGELAGFFTLLIEEPDFYTTEQAARLMAYASQAAMAISRARLIARLSWYATTDPLTGVSNRRSFYERAEQELERAQRYNRSYSVMLLDIDHFKQVNDTHGHMVGDQVLQEIAGFCLRSLRKSDLMGRLGGEEFVFALPETDLQAARAIAERLREGVAALAFRVAGEELHVSVSIGVTQRDAGASSLQTLIACTDQALYQAKSEGRNRVVVSEAGCQEK